MTKKTGRLMASALTMFLVSCAGGPTTQSPTAASIPGAPRGEEIPQAVADPSGDMAAADVPGARQELVSLGTGVFVRQSGTGKDAGFADGDGVTLNFDQANLREFLAVVFDTILNDNYVIDPQVQGVVTLQTTRPIEKNAVLSIVEAVLQANGAALVRDEGLYKIVPIGKAAGLVGSPAVGRYPSASSRGFGIQVVPLEFASAAEVAGIIDDFLVDGATVRADELRNVLILSGPRYRLDEMLATIRTFDVDWMEGMSFGLFRLRYADAETLIEEIQQVIGDQEGMKAVGSVRLVPIARLNAVLVISHQPGFINAVKELVEQFDWGTESAAGRRLYVYELENAKAESVAQVLQDVFGQSRSDSSRARDGGRGSRATDVFRSADSLTEPPPPPGGRSAAGDGPDGAQGAEGQGILAEGQGDVTIIADNDNNAILVLASQQGYRAVESAIRRLDVAPRQVLMEATIAEVTLSNTLGYGVRWFLENSNYELGFGAPVPTGASGEGLAFAFFDADSDVRAFFSALATESSVKFLSTPQVMVLDNQTANIRVGDQIPVTTRSSQSTVNPDAPIVTEVQFRDTGTLLTVTPRIKAGGQVAMDISLEVSIPGSAPAIGGSGNVAIAQRTIDSSVVVESGQTVVLGGLILENKNLGTSGIPILMNIPVLGKLFSSTTEDVFRTELIVTLSPRVIEDRKAMQQVTEELRRRMIHATELEQSATE